MQQAPWCLLTRYRFGSIWCVSWCFSGAWTIQLLRGLSNNPRVVRVFVCVCVCVPDLMWHLRGCDSSRCLQKGCWASPAPVWRLFTPQNVKHHTRKELEGIGPGTEGDEIWQLSSVFFVCAIISCAHEKKQRNVQLVYWVFHWLLSAVFAHWPVLIRTKPRLSIDACAEPRRRRRHSVIG